MRPEAESFLAPGHNCWRVESANRFTFIIDAADYFVALREAMLKAQKSIMLIGWDFDARIKFGDPNVGPVRLGDFILWLADQRPDLEIRLLRWDTGAFKSMLRGTTLLTILRWKAHPRITLRLDAAHPLASSHHQKIAVIDDSVAFCGGIDMTLKRWDTPDHIDDDPRRVSPSGRKHAPWHDAASAFDGDAARALGDLARDRWLQATGETLPACDPATMPKGHDHWPQSLVPTFTDMRLGIARSRPKMENVEPIHEVEDAYLDLIARTKTHLYAESQYFASRKIAHAIAERLVEEDPPEFVLVTPHSSEGWLEPLAMDSARARLVEAIQRIDKMGRFAIYHPVTKGGAEIYVHAKIMISDEDILRVGSSNMNNRSMRLDTECDVILAVDETGNDHLADEIGGLRNKLMAEHLDVTPEDIARSFAETGSLIKTVEALRGSGRSLVPYELPKLSGFEEWLADNEILDPNGPDELFEYPSKRGLFKGWSRIRNRLSTRLAERRRRRKQRKG